MSANGGDSAIIDTPADIGWRRKCRFAQKHQENIMFTMGMALNVNRIVFKTA